jgi:hypothetical protein
MDLNEGRDNFSTLEFLDVGIITGWLFLYPTVDAGFFPGLLRGNLVWRFFGMPQPFGITQRPLSRLVISRISRVSFPSELCLTQIAAYWAID